MKSNYLKTILFLCLLNGFPSVLCAQNSSPKDLQNNWVISPNPTSSKLDIQIKNMLCNSGILSLFDSYGREYHRTFVYSNTTPIVLETFNLSAGNYTLVLRWEDGSTQQSTVLIQK